MTLDFAAARRTVAAQLDTTYRDGPQHPTPLPYGYDTGTAWAPMIAWDGIMGTYIWLVDKETGALTPLGFPQFLDIPEPAKVGDWPREP